MMTLCDLLQLKYPDINVAVFSGDFQLGDTGDGLGARIMRWSYPNASQPTAEDLDSWAVEFDLPFRQQQAIQARVYPSVQDQLDMIYHDKVDNTNTWQSAIAAVKAAHPKITV